MSSGSKRKNISAAASGKTTVSSVSKAKANTNGSGATEATSSDKPGLSKHENVKHKRQKKNSVSASGSAVASASASASPQQGRNERSEGWKSDDTDTDTDSEVEEKPAPDPAKQAQIAANRAAGRVKAAATRARKREKWLLERGYAQEESGTANKNGSGTNDPAPSDKDSVFQHKLQKSSVSASASASASTSIPQHGRPKGWKSNDTDTEDDDEDQATTKAAPDPAKQEQIAANRAAGRVKAAATRALKKEKEWYARKEQTLARLKEIEKKAKEEEEQRQLIAVRKFWRSSSATTVRVELAKLEDNDRKTKIKQLLEQVQLGYVRLPTASVMQEVHAFPSFLTTPMTCYKMPMHPLAWHAINMKEQERNDRMLRHHARISFQRAFSLYPATMNRHFLADIVRLMMTHNDYSSGISACSDRDRACAVMDLEQILVPSSIFNCANAHTTPAQATYMASTTYCWEIILFHSSATPLSHLWPLVIKMVEVVKYHLHLPGLFFPENRQKQKTGSPKAAGNGGRNDANGIGNIRAPNADSSGSGSDARNGAGNRAWLDLWRQSDDMRGICSGSPQAIAQVGGVKFDITDTSAERKWLPEKSQSVWRTIVDAESELQRNMPDVLINLTLEYVSSSVYTHIPHELLERLQRLVTHIKQTGGLAALSNNEFDL